MDPGSPGAVAQRLQQFTTEDLLSVAGAGCACCGQQQRRFHAQLWLEHVSVADYLAQSGVVYQTNDVQYVIAQNNLWASPLDQQLQQTLVTNLSSALPGWVVSSQPMSSDQDVLNVTISGFHGRFDGKAIIRGEWVLNRQGHLIKRPFNLELKQGEDGYDALVRTLAQGWQQEAQAIAAQMDGI